MSFPDDLRDFVAKYFSDLVISDLGRLEYLGESLSESNKTRMDVVAGKIGDEILATGKNFLAKEFPELLVLIGYTQAARKKAIKEALISYKVASNTDEFRYLPLHDIDRSGKTKADFIVFQDKLNDEILNINPITVFDYFYNANMGDLKDWDAYLAKAKHIRMEYDPTTLQRYKNVPGEEFQILNMHTPPSWKNAAEKPFPDVLKHFLDYFIPCKESQSYVLKWVYMALTSRAPTILCLLSTPGTGKSGFFIRLLSNLIGDKNCFIESASGFSNKFNSGLAYKQLYVVEEVRIERPKDKEILKTLDNPTLTIEPKGQNKRNIKNTVSTILVSNYFDALYLRLDDRKFSIPDTTELPMEQSEKFKGTRSKNELRKAIDDPGVIKAFQQFIVNNYKPTEADNMFMPFKGHKYERALLASAPFFIHEIFSNIINGKSDRFINVTETAKKYRKERRSNFPYEPFYEYVKNFTWYGKPLGELDFSEKEIILKVDDRFTSSVDSSSQKSLLEQLL